MNSYNIALRESFKMWQKHGFGSPPDDVVEQVHDVVVDAMRRDNVVLSMPYLRAAGRYKAARLADKEHIYRNNMEEMKTEVARQEQAVPQVESIVESRLRFAQVVTIGRALPMQDKTIVAKLIDGTATANDRNDIRRIRRVLEG